MTLYLYRIGTSVPLVTMENVVSYTDVEVVTTQGAYAPLDESCELSVTSDCTGTLRADWREGHPSDRVRIEELEAVVADLLFGGEEI